MWILQWFSILSWNCVKKTTIKFYVCYYPKKKTGGHKQPLPLPRTLPQTNIPLDSVLIDLLIQYSCRVVYEGFFGQHPLSGGGHQSWSWLYNATLPAPRTLRGKSP